jgi:hypothetical protein
MVARELWMGSSDRLGFTHLHGTTRNCHRASAIPSRRDALETVAVPPRFANAPANTTGRERFEMTITMDAFAADPFADHSARFPLSRANPVMSNATPSEPAVRPWSLRGMCPAPQ